MPPQPSPDILATPPPEVSDPMLLSPTPPAAPSDSGKTPAETKLQDKSKTKPAQPKNSSVRLAIVATTIIVIALSALAVYAYLKQRTLG
jgi:hypothetical protein